MILIIYVIIFQNTYFQMHIDMLLQHLLCDCNQEYERSMSSLLALTLFQCMKHHPEVLVWCLGQSMLQYELLNLHMMLELFTRYRVFLFSSPWGNLIWGRWPLRVYREYRLKAQPSRWLAYYRTSQIQSTPALLELTVHGGA